MLSYGDIVSAQSVTQSDAGVYHTLGILAIIAGIISFILIAALATPKARRSRELRFEDGDPFDDEFRREQKEFFKRAMSPRESDEPATIVPGDNSTETLTVIGDLKAITGIIVDRPFEVLAPIDDADCVLARIREDNAAFLQKWGVSA